MFLRSVRRDKGQLRKAFSICVESLEERALLSFTPFDMFPGNPVTAGVPKQFPAVGTADVTTKIAEFKTAIGGSDNGNTASSQPTGSRDINWDAVTFDGKDFGGGANTTVISSGTTVGIPQNRFQTRGVFFDTVYAVSGDGFKTVNPAADPASGALFPAFSPKNTFAMFNDNTIDFSFVTPTPTGTAPAPAASRGFGAVFDNVVLPGTTITLFDGPRLLQTFDVPVGTARQTEFLGILYDSPIITKVTLTLGTDTLFKFDGKMFQAGSVDDATHNIVVTDDFVYAEPQPIPNALPVLDGSQGTNSAAANVSAQVAVPFTGTVATFSSANPAATAADFFAVINWGDGHLSNGVVKANANGGFDVSGTNTFATAGLIPVAVTAYDFGGSEVTIANTAKVSKAASQIALTSSVTNGTAGQSVVFTATVTNPTGSPAPTGNVTFLDGTTTLAIVPLDANGAAKYTTTLTPGKHTITASYAGDSNSATVTSSAVSPTISADVTSLLKITIGKRRRRRGGFVQMVTLKNMGANAIGGPIYFVLDNLSSNARLVNSADVTKNNAPLGSPFLKISDDSLGVGASQTLNLLINVRRGRVNFVSRVLARVTEP